MKAEHDTSFQTLSSAIGWMRNRGWDRILAKEHGFRQTLFDHTLRHLDLWFTLHPLLAGQDSARLTEDEFRLLLAGSTLHDLGKEKPKFQAYLDGGPPTSHTLPSDFRHGLHEVCQLFEVTDAESVYAFTRLSSVHDQGGFAGLAEAFRPHGSSRWASLRDLVNSVDQSVSAHSLESARAAVSRTALGKFVVTTIHRVQFRGTLTPFLHEACEGSFRSEGWTPLLHFTDGTVYVAKGSQPPTIPTHAQIREQTIAVLDPVVRASVSPSLVVGSPITAALPKPELFDWRAMRPILEAAHSRVHPMNYKKKKWADRELTARKALARRNEEPTEGAIREMDAIIAVGQPEIMVLRVLKSAMDLLPDSDRSELERFLDDLLGWPFAQALRSQSTLSPAIDIPDRILPLWETPGECFGLQHDHLRDAPDAERRDALIATFAQAFEQVALRSESAPTGLDASTLADAALQDLLEPADHLEDAVRLAAEQLDGYARAKQLLFSERRGFHICPVCNSTFERGSAAREAFFPKPKTFTNRASALSRLGSVVICDNCRAEAIFRQLLLGDTAQHFLILLPRLNVGRNQGAEFLLAADRMRQAFAQALDQGETIFSLANTWNASGELLRLAEAPTPEQLVELYTYTPKPPSRTALVQKVIEQIKDRYETLDEFNSFFISNFGDLEQAASAVLDGALTEEDALALLPPEARKDRPPKVICRTANMMLIPLRGPIALAKDSDANAAIRTVFVAISFGLAFAASAVIIPAGDSLPGLGGEGIAWVPPIPSVRTLFRGEWVSELDAEEWVIAIAAAARFGDIYPDRSSLLRILTATSPGEIARRFEMSGPKGPRILSRDQVRLIEFIRPMLTGNRR